MNRSQNTFQTTSRKTRSGFLSLTLGVVNTVVSTLATASVVILVIVGIISVIMTAAVAS
ncbi:MAG TPA: hypothetical protein PLL06_04600 [Acidobacteriota bacterium]|nr:hypothetical protein [Acidobacteriota bacterium]HNB70046.1 hypothetical protein [Acidobacteriota bacterium]HND17821.1 hypothetical protein [Acidobacteriota bacterium]HNG93617.1 hypothetical protein [Acidobacteriota bacterium]HNH80933.1 hypothetical protein [Acidobacteriota bacterium]